jgi:5S rRNA maturation endonuclease (ribonuclease M5)
MVGFIRGRLSHNELNYHWQKNPKGIYPFPKTIKYICDFLKVKYNSIKIDPREEERRKFIAECTASISVSQSHLNMKKDRVQKNLIIPAQYFIDRGFSNDILVEYDVGIAKRSKPETANRVIVPIYNKDQFLIGYTCRSIFEKCESCALYHHPKSDCPTENFEKNIMTKWRHMNFNAQQTLYNFWEAKPEIIKTNTAILVEGPADVWKLAEANIKNVVGLFGNTLYDGQEHLLASAQCMTIIGLLDNDEAGAAGIRNIKEKYGRLFRMYFPRLNGEAKDVGELNSDAITNSVKPIIDKIMGLYK